VARGKIKYVLDGPEVEHPSPLGFVAIAAKLESGPPPDVPARTKRCLDPWAYVSTNAPGFGEVKLEWGNPSKGRSC
jgi:hypothetical protein